MADLYIRWLIRRDLPEALQIERDSSEQPRSEAEFLDCLKLRNCIGMIAERDEKVLGFAIYMLEKGRLVVCNLAVHPSYRRQGVGAALVQKLLGKLSSHRRPKIAIQVRETNLAAQLFLYSQGFMAVGVDRKAYGDTQEDAYQFVFKLAEPKRPSAEVVDAEG